MTTAAKTIRKIVCIGKLYSFYLHHEYSIFKTIHLSGIFPKRFSIEFIESLKIDLIGTFLLIFS